MKVNWATSPSSAPKQDTSSEYKNIYDMQYIIVECLDLDGDGGRCGRDLR